MHYKDLLKRRPEILKHIPQYYIAAVPAFQPHRGFEKRIKAHQANPPELSFSVKFTLPELEMIS